MQPDAAYFTFPELRKHGGFQPDGPPSTTITPNTVSHSSQSQHPEFASKILAWNRANSVN
jgi:hypothetical protein